MKYLLLGLIGTIVLYEIIAQVSEHCKRNPDRYEDARRNRLRVLNQVGQINSEVNS